MDQVIAVQRAWVCRKRQSAPWIIRDLGQSLVEPLVQEELDDIWCALADAWLVRPIGVDVDQSPIGPVLHPTSAICVRPVGRHELPLLARWGNGWRHGRR